MKEKEFTKLNVDLPTQPIIKQRPWLVAGLLFVFTILLIAACAYFMM
ncbi:MAG: hypothetical protein ABR502_08730 [Chitinophagaceae bacterium]